MKRRLGSYSFVALLLTRYMRTEKRAQSVLVLSVFRDTLSQSRDKHLYEAFDLPICLMTVLSGYYLGYAKSYDIAASGCELLAAIC